MLAIIDKAMKKGHEYVSWSRFEVNRGIVLVNKIFLMEGEMQPIEATSCGRLRATIVMYLRDVKMVFTCMKRSGPEWSCLDA